MKSESPVTVGRPRLQKFALLFALNAAAFLICAGSGERLGSDVLLVPLAVIPLVIFNQREKWAIALGALPPFLLMAFVSRNGLEPLAAGTCFALIYFVRRVGERTEASLQAALSEALAMRQRRELLFDRTPLAAIEWDAQVRVTRWNPAAERVFGYTAEEAIGKSFTFIVPESDLSLTSEAADALSKASGGLRMRNRNKRKDGAIVTCDWYNTSLTDAEGRVIGVASLAEDVTEQALAQRRAEERFRALLDHSPLMIDSFDAQGKCVLWNRACEGALGYRMDEINAAPDALELFYPDNDERERVRQAIVNPDGAFREYRVRAKDGGTRHQRWANVVLPTGETISMGYDVTELRQAETALRGLNEQLERKVEDRTRTIINHQQMISQILGTLPISVVAKDIQDDYRFILWNHSAERLFGLKAEECLGKTDYDLFPKEQADFFRAKDLETNALEGVLEIPEEVANTAFGQAVLRTKKCVVRDSGGKPKFLLVQIEDITAVKERERLIQDQRAKLFTSAKLSALGEMAGGIAHEINNPLSIVLARARQLREGLERGVNDPAIFSRHLASIEQTGERISRIVRALRTLSRDGDGDAFEEVQLKSILNDSLELCRERFKLNGIELAVEAPAEDLMIRCRSVQVAQVLINLLGNAHDAVIGLREKWVRVKVAEAESFVEISVTDSGKGISAEIREKVMQPFFTTKEVGRGTGLGLSISRGIAESHGGDLRLDASCPNTRFVLILPSLESRMLKAA